MVLEGDVKVFCSGFKVKLIFEYIYTLCVRWLLILHIVEL